MPYYVKKIRTTDDSTEHRLVGSVIPVSPESFGMKAGAALTEGMIVFKSTETGSSSINKIYPITNTSKYVDLNWGLAVVKKACTSGTILNGDYIAQQGVYTYSSATAGRAYGIKLTYDGTGYKMASSTLSTLIVDMSTVTDGYFIYMGIGQVSGSDKIIACDFSNHLFFRFKNNRVVQINGRDVDTLHPSVPVSPDSVGITTGAAIAAGDIIFRCKTDNKVYPISNTTNYLDLEWGLAIAKEACNASSLYPGNSILQQGVISYASATAGRDYGLSVVYDGTGYKINTGTPANLDSVTDGIMIYMGVGQVYNGVGTIACDFSNHTFFKVENSKVTALNGRKISTDDANVPVSVDAQMPPAGEALNNSIVFKCVSDGKLYAIDSTDRLNKAIDLDWGIALCKPNIAANTIPENNKVVQKAEIDYLSTLLPSGSTTTDGDDLYFYCSVGNNPTPRGALGSVNVYSTGHIGNYSDVKSWAQTYGGCVYMYVGQAIFNSTPQLITATAITQSQYIPPSGTGTGTPSDYQDVHIFTVLPGAKYFVTASYGSGYGSYVANYYDNDGIRIGTEYLQTNNNYVDAELTLPEGTRTIKCNFRKADTAACMRISRMGISLDTSNHTFYTIDEASKIIEINGVPIYQVTIPDPDYRNPVSGDSLMPLAYNAIAVNSLVFKGTDGELRAISSANRGEEVDPDWGLAIYRGSSEVTADSRPDNNTLMQQCQWSGGGVDLSSFTAGDQLYAVFDTSTRDNNGIAYPLVCETGLVLTNRAGLATLADGGVLVYCYVGTLIVNNSSRTIAVDLSAHQFITEDFSQNKITDINGVATGGAVDFKAYNSTSGISNGRFTYYFQLKKIAVPGPGVYRSWLNINLYNFKPYPIEVYLCNYAVFVDPNSNTVGNNPTEKKIINIPPYTCYNACMESIVRVSPDMIEDNPTYVLGYGYRYEVSEQKHVYVIGELPEKHITVDIPYSISIGASNYYVRDELQDMVLNSTQYYGWTKFDNKNTHVWTTVLPALTASGIGTVYYYSKTGNQLGVVDIARHETKNIYERYQDGDYKIDKEGQEIIWYAWKCLSRPTYSDDTYGLYNFQYLIYTESETPSSTESSYVSGQRRYTVYQDAFDNYANYLCGKVLDYKQEPNEAPFSQLGIIRIGDYDANTNADGGGGGFDSVVDVWENN